MKQYCIAACLLSLAFASARAQSDSPANKTTLASSSLPDSPGTTLQTSTQPNASAGQANAKAGQTNANTSGVPAGSQQTKRILGVIPNFRSVSSDQRIPPQSPKEKFRTGFLDSFDYSSAIFVAAQSGVAMANKSTPEFHQGAAGYGRYFWHTYADYADENLWTESILPIALKQDSRYYTKGRGNVALRAGYAFTRVFVTRNDAGNETVNTSEIVGAGAASGISALYYPGREKTWTKVGQRWLTSVIIDGGTFTFKEFWPDINNAFFHQKN